MDVTNVVAGNIRAIREQKKLTLDAASALTGVSRSMLAQIEKGDVNPTISVLWKIANGYKVPLRRCWKKRRMRSGLSGRWNRRHWKRTGEGI